MRDVVPFCPCAAQGRVQEVACQTGWLVGAEVSHQRGWNIQVTFRPQVGSGPLSGAQGSSCSWGGVWLPSTFPRGVSPSTWVGWWGLLLQFASFPIGSEGATTCIGKKRMGDEVFFYFTLPSNACFSIFHWNTSSAFIIGLVFPLELVGAWEEFLV